MSLGNIDHWYELVAYLVLIVVGPGGGVMIANKLSERRNRQRRSEDVAESVRAHQEVFDQSIAALEERLTRQIARALQPVADKADDLRRDLSRVENKIDTDRTRFNRLERDTYAAISRTERVIAKHHPEDAA